jgi:hypothetical protein
MRRGAGVVLVNLLDESIGRRGRSPSERSVLRNIKDIEGFAISATDGVLGHIRNFYFDDESWVVRYFVVETGAWKSNRRTLISPMAMGTPDWSAKLIPAALTQQQVKDGPDIDTDKPVSRQHEIGYLGYYGYPNYWGGGGLWGAGLYPDVLQAGLDRAAASNSKQRTRQLFGHSRAETRRQNDRHLRSANEVMRYYVHASDGDIGHVQGILVEEKTWAIRYIIVNTSNWWLGHDVLIAPEWIDDVYWAESKLMVALTRQSVRDAPEYDSKVPITREHEKILHAHYGHSGYWPHEDEPRSTPAHT